jgi:hypothetical protein
MDSSGRSIEYKDLKSIIKKLQKEKFAVVVMSEYKFDFSKDGFADEVAMPDNVSLRQWASVIKNCDHFLGCDSVGQHLSYQAETLTTIVIGSTFPVNVSYPDCEYFNIIDLGMHDRVYDPIRILPDEYTSRKNENIMYMSAEIQDYVVDTVLGKNPETK